MRNAKGGKAREVPILPELAHELRTHLAGRRAGWLFETWSAKPYSARRVQYLVREVATAAGIEHRVWPHLLRHTIAQHLIDRGMPVDQVRRFLGHHDLKTTQVYAEASAAATGAGYRRALGGDGVSGRWSDAGDLGAPSPALFRPPAKRGARGARGGPDARAGRRSPSTGVPMTAIVFPRASIAA